MMWSGKFYTALHIFENYLSYVIQISQFPYRQQSLPYNQP